MIILVADDDEDDRLLMQDAVDEGNLAIALHFVENGEELLDYLYRREQYSDVARSPLPDLILLDLNMPKKDGRETLAEIKANSDFRQIPVVILTTSKTAEDIHRSYKSGGNSFITKPVSFEGLVEVMKTLGEYWFDVVELPQKN